MTPFLFIQIYIYIEKILEGAIQYFGVVSLGDIFAYFLVISTF